MYNDIIDLLQLLASATVPAHTTDHVCGALNKLLQGIHTSPAGILNHIADFEPEGAKDVCPGTTPVATANQLKKRCFQCWR